MDHMRESPEDLKWLKTHVRPRFWRKFVTEVNASKPPGAPDIQELPFCSFLVVHFPFKFFASGWLTLKRMLSKQVPEDQIAATGVVIYKRSGIVDLRRHSHIARLRTVVSLNLVGGKRCQVFS